MTTQLTKNDIDNMSQEELQAFIASEEIIIHQLDKRQHAIKILSNSIYGALATKYFRLFSVICAESITLTGQTITAESFRMFNDYQNKVLKTDKDYIAFSDTDSAAVDFSDFVNEFIGKHLPFEKKLNKLTHLADGFFNDMLTKTFDDFALELNSVSNNIIMKREKIAKAIIVAAKNYIVNVYDNEGVRYSKPKLSVTGLEAIKAFTPVVFKDALLDCYKICLDGTEAQFQTYIQKLSGSVGDLNVNDICGNTSVNKLDTYQDSRGYPIKGTPGHVKGALAYNRLVSGSDLHMPIHSGDKVFTVKLLEPNPIHADSIAFPDNYPSDLISEEYVDKHGLFEKYFLKPVQRVSNIVSFNVEQKQELSLF